MSLNPLGMPEGVRRVLAENIDRLSQYPDPYGRSLIRMLSERMGVSPEKLVLGNGAADLIYRIADILKPRRALLVSPCFSEYEKALSEAGCEVFRESLSGEEDFRLCRVPELKKGEVDLVVCASPANPNGALVSPALLKELYERCAHIGALLLVDACFMGLAADEDGRFCGYDPRAVCGFGIDAGTGTSGRGKLIVLDAFTKTYALAGLRLGFASISDSALAAVLRERGQHWKVSTAALLAGAAALSEEGYLEKTRIFVAREREYLKKGLSKLGIRTYPSDANFLLFRAEEALSKRLLKDGIGIRDCANFHGLSKGYYRAAVRTHEENSLLLEAIGQGKE